MQDHLRSIPDAGTLRILASGLEITRRTKHESIDSSSLSQRQLEHLTDKRNGSKFLSNWPLERVVDWVAQEVNNAGWTLRPGRTIQMDCRLHEPVGLVRGQQVHTIRIRCDGRYVHAYPVRD